MDIDKQVICPLCHGSGAKSDSDVVTCTTCRGTGVRIVQQVIMGAFIQHTQSTCDACKGKGKTIRHACTLCKGKRVGRNHREGIIQVERGVQEGATIVQEGAGDEHPDKIAGPIVFHVSIEPHPIFSRNKDNLYTTETITLQEVKTSDAFLSCSKK